MTRHAWLIVLPLLLAGVPGGGAQPPAATGLDHFKYGSVGIEPEEGVPYWIWQALPRVFPDLLPGGYASLGFVWEPGHELPIGFSSVRCSARRVAINCAFCTPRPTVSAAAPARSCRVAPAAWCRRSGSRAFSTAAADPRFSASTLVPAISQLGTLSWFESVTYRLLLIPGTRRACSGTGTSSLDGPPARLGARAHRFHQPLQVPPAAAGGGQSIGTADMTPLWSPHLRDGRALHWDGLNPSLAEALVGSALGNGASVSRWTSRASTGSARGRRTAASGLAAAVTTPAWRRAVAPSSTPRAPPATPRPARAWGR